MSTETQRYTIDFESSDRILACRLYGFLDDVGGRKFGVDLSAAIDRHRSDARPIHFLIDNREGRVASQLAATALAERLATVRRVGDRTAVLVADSLCKMQAKRFQSEDYDVFLSENAARTWLTAHASIRSPGVPLAFSHDAKASALNR